MWASVYVVGAAFALAAIPPLLGQRTFLLQGAGPHPAWYLPLAALGILAVVVPASCPRGLQLNIWRGAPAALVLLPFVPASFQVALAMIGVAGLLALSRSALACRIAGLVAAVSTTWMVCVLTAAVYAHIDARLSNYAVLGVPLAATMNLLGRRYAMHRACAVLPTGSGASHTLFCPF